MSWPSHVTASFLKKFVSLTSTGISIASVSEVIVTDYHRRFNPITGRIEHLLTLYNVDKDDRCSFKCWFSNNEFYYKREW